MSICGLSRGSRCYSVGMGRAGCSRGSLYCSGWFC